jgi:hypothetical protein
VTDACGNLASINQTIKVKDTAPPTIENCPADETRLCDEDITVPPAPNATDDCGILRRDFECCIDNNVITRNWTFTDRCGKETLCTQKVSIVCPTKKSKPEVQVDPPPLAERTPLVGTRRAACRKRRQPCKKKADCCSGLAGRRGKCARA